MVKEDSELELRLLVNRLEFLRAGEKAVVFERLETVSDLHRVNNADLESWLSRRVKASWRAVDLVRKVHFDLRFLDRDGTWVLWGQEPAFPAALRQICDPPWLLWGRGNWPEAACWAAMVGTRYPTESAKKAAQGFAGDLAGSGAVVVSGLAHGIDACSHAGALRTGTTVAVLGNGIDWVSPVTNQRLASRILASGGALVSEYGPGDEAFPWRFVARNRLISGLCRSVMVVQAPRKSGALITADFALDQGRDVVVHRDGLEGERGEGTRELVRQGAPVIGSVGELEAVWNGEMVPGTSEQSWLEGLA